MREYYVGLDMGTSSVGWAVTDTEYNLMRAKGKDMWGVRLFDEAQVAAGRRTQRISRRRTQRSQARIGYVREIFDDAVKAVDPGFFMRLDESFLHLEDKSVRNPNAVFSDELFKDSDYFHRYPTIFHLRKELIYSNQPHDVRLVYLAIVNIFKHRGHFLNEGLDVENVGGSFADLYHELCTVLSENVDINLSQYIDTAVLQEILTQKHVKRKKTFDNAVTFLDIKKDKRACEVLKLVCGLSGKLSTVFNAEELSEAIESKSISFESDNEELFNEMSEEQLQTMAAVQALHDSILLMNTMEGFSFLSEARIAMYEEHKKDLKALKNVYLKYAPEKYDDMFRRMQDNNYSAYVGSVNSKEEKCRRRNKVKNKGDFYKVIKKDLEGMPSDDETVSYILGRIETDEFLPKQLTRANGVIPNQLHAAELKAILKNAENYLPFLLEKDESGKTASERILMLFSFCMPYYVGTLKNGWAVRREEGRVYPWNIEQKIDMKQTAAEFILRMVRHCTYLNGEEALPDSSLLYERYKVLNELNSISIRGARIDNELKQRIYNDLFKKGKKVRRRQLFNYLVGLGVLEKNEESEITGLDGDFKNSLSSYGRFKAVLGDDIEKDSVKKMVEDIIFWGTIYSDDKKMFIHKVEEVYGDCLDAEQLKRIKGFKFGSWGRLSRTFLMMEGCDISEESTGEIMSLIGAMWNTKYNMMELLGSGFTYKDTLQDMVVASDKLLSEYRYSDLDGMYLSNPVKRMVWQTLLVLKEIEKVMGCPPKRIFVEMARFNGVKGERKDSRKKKLSDLYNALGKEGAKWKEEIEKLDEGRFNQKKLYLYYMQKGRCMYTNTIIPIEDLFKDNLYDIDHVYPRHFVKDDSIENNLVLVRKQDNAHKSDSYPIESGIQGKCGGFWKELMNGGFISREKYFRLTRTEEFSEQELASFISRQIVETGQGTKAVASILREALPDTKIVYVKASNVSAFRQDRDLLKVRSVNDFHHANDAYLNIVVGNVYFTKFTDSPLNFVRDFRRNPEKYKYHQYKMFDYDVKRRGEVAWVAQKKDGNCGTIATVKKVMARNTPLVTMMSYEGRGQLMDQTIYRAEKARTGSGYIPLKKEGPLSDVVKYGGYTNAPTAYFSLVEYIHKKKRVRAIVAVPVLWAESIQSKTELVRYLEEQCGLVKPTVKIAKINIKSTVRIDGFEYYLTGRTESRLVIVNAVQLCLSQAYMAYIKKIEKFCASDATEPADEYITKDANLELYDVLTEKHRRLIFSKRVNSVGDKLHDDKPRFVELSIREQCIVLLNILQLSQRINKGADLTLIKESKQTGVTKVNSVISQKEFLLINKSVTGLFENSVDLTKI